MEGAALDGGGPQAPRGRLSVPLRAWDGAGPPPDAETAALWTVLAERNRAITVAVGMARWKQAAIARFLWAEGRAPLRFTDDPDEALAAGGDLAAWASRLPPHLAGRPDVLRVEDGFIRSVGLGAGLVPPCSIVVDARGIYYDPRGPSDLEHILQHAPFPPDLLARAERLAATVVAQGISKYGREAPPPPQARRDGARVVLVAGQVEDDASVQAGGAGVAGNLDLLRRARAAEPDARILFKPHPDVDAGYRRGRIPDTTALTHADAVVRDRGVAALLGEVDAVHVLTSLAGFEALLRGRAVVTHGHPFYAGWGLTHDLAGPVPRRTRRLSLAQLVAGTLILYPRYLDPVTQTPCPPETVLARFAAGWRPRRTLLVAARQWQGRLARLVGTTTD